MSCIDYTLACTRHPRCYLADGHSEHCLAPDGTVLLIRRAATPPASEWEGLRDRLLEVVDDISDESGDLIHWEVDLGYWELPQGPIPFLTEIAKRLATPPASERDAEARTAVLPGQLPAFEELEP